MRALVLILFTVIILPALAQDFKESTLKTEIEEVTVFLQGAQVTRTGKAAIKSGKSVLVIKSLSPHIDEKSIQVKATGQFTVLSVKHRLNYLNELAKDAKADSLANEIKTIENRMKELRNQIYILDEGISVLDMNKGLGGENVAVGLTALKQAIDFYRRELTAIKQEQL